MPFVGASSDQQPTRVRHVVVFLATLMAVLLYLDRICLSFLERYVKEDLGLTNDQAGLLLSAFFWSYALGQVPAGWFSDRFGARGMLALYILLWSLFTGLMGLAQSFVALLLFRFGCGLAQAGAYPTSASIISKWVPFPARGLASGIVSTGGRIGGAAAPVLTAFLLLAFVPGDADPSLKPHDIMDRHELVQELEKAGAARPGDVRAAIRLALEKKAGPLPSLPTTELVDALNNVLREPALLERLKLSDIALPSEAQRLAAVPAEELSPRQIERRNRLVLEAAFPKAIRKLYRLGWRPVLITYGVAGLIVAGWFWLSVRNRPQEHPRCNSAEIELIESSRPATATSPHGRVGALPLRYLVRNFSLWCSALSQFGTNFGWVFLITWLPRYLEEAHHVPVGRRGVMASLPLLIGMGGMVAGGWLTDRLTRAVGLRWGRCLPMALTRFLAMAAYLVCLALDSPWPVVAALCVVAVATDLGTPAVWAFKQDVGGRHVGSVLGWGNMWGNFGAAVSPLVLTRIVDHSGWPACFVACAAAFLLAGIASFGVDATKPIVPPDVEKTLGERHNATSA